MKITYRKIFWGKDRKIEVRETQAGYPYKNDYRKLKEALKDGCWWAKATDDKEG